MPSNKTVGDGSFGLYGDGEPNVYPLLRRHAAGLLAGGEGARAS